MIGTRTYLNLIALTSGLILGSLAALAQDSGTKHSPGYTAILDNMDLLVDNYARMLARKYDLSEEQGVFTRDLLKDKVKKFMGGHDGEIRELLSRMLEVRAGGEMSQEELLAWGQRVQPLVNEAKQMILDGNNQWREILTDQQKQIHDQDVKLMNESMASTEQNLSRIVSGQMSVDEFRSASTTRPRRTPPQVAAQPQPTQVATASPPRMRDKTEAPPPSKTDGAVAMPPGQTKVASGDDAPNPEGAGVAPPQPQQTTPPIRHKVEPTPTAQPQQPAQPVQPGRAARRGGPGATPAVQGKGFEGEWQRYTEQFIQKYKLNEDQTTRANAILKDCLEQGERTMKSRQSQIEQLDKQTADLNSSQDKDKAAKLAELNTQRQKLLEPLTRIFEGQLKPRLDALPTRAQRKAAETPPPAPAAPQPGQKPPVKEKK